MLTQAKSLPNGRNRVGAGRGPSPSEKPQPSPHLSTSSPTVAVLVPPAASATGTAPAEFARQVAYGDDFGSAHVQGGYRRRAMAEQPERLLVGLALPDDVDVSHADVDRLAGEHLCRDVVQHPVAHVDGIFQAHQA